MMDANERKLGALRFLSTLEKQLNARIPSPSVMRKSIHAIVDGAKNDPKLKHMRQPEDAFLYHYAVPVIFDHMRTQGIHDDEARQSLLSEYFQNMKQYCLDTPARTQGHPFSKVIGAKPAEIIARWKRTSGTRLTQSCPDFALRDPFPFKIVFEGKYFANGGLVHAGHELVAQIYQAFFYRALPYVAPKGKSSTKSSPAWDYEFACLLVYDASKDGTMKATWTALNAEVRKGFWDGANVYVMILRGKD
jgi:hypothetical protein